MNEETTISCPECGAEIPLTEAVSHHLREQLELEFTNKRKALNATLAERELKLKNEQAALGQQAEALQTEIARQVGDQRQQLLSTARAEVEKTLGIELQTLHRQLSEKDGKLKLAREAELALLKQQGELEETKAGLELEVARQLSEGREKIAAHARQQAVEAERLKQADKDNVIDNLKKQISDLQQKAEQGSMQAQGETLELALESNLRASFPSDNLAEVKKGERGADVTQLVRTSTGLTCGTILWEAKRAKNWSAQWPEKLKEDQRSAGAELAVLVTTCPPAGVRGIGEAGGIWVCEPPFAGALAAALRHGLIATMTQRLQDADRGNKMAVLYDHLCGLEFRHHIQAVVESFIGLQEQLDAEKRAFARQWKEREKQLQKAILHTGELYGGIQGIAGREALPDVQSLQLPE